MHCECDCILGCCMRVRALALAWWYTAVCEGVALRRVAMERCSSCAVALWAGWLKGWWGDG